MPRVRFGDQYSHLQDYPFKQRKGVGTVRLANLLPSVDRESVIRVNILEQIHPETSVYEALSYAWKTESQLELVLCEPIERHEATYSSGDTERSEERLVRRRDRRSIATITTDLAEAIRCLRRPEQERLLWIDALCVRNGDHSDVAQQLNLTRTLYSKAQCTFLWIGSQDTSTAGMLGLIETLSDATGKVTEALERNEHIQARADKSQSPLEHLPRLGATGLNIINHFENVVSRSPSESWTALGNLVSGPIFER